MQQQLFLLANSSLLSGVEAATQLPVSRGLDQK
jgi:hypothetical protein